MKTVSKFFNYEKTIVNNHTYIPDESLTENILYKNITLFIDLNAICNQNFAIIENYVRINLKNLIKKLIN